MRRSHTSTPCAPPPPTPAAALVEDEPSSSTAKRGKIHVDPFVRDWFLDMSCHWRTRSACVRSGACAPGCSTGSTRTLPTAGNGAHDVTRLSEHILRVTDVLCLSAVTIRGLVHEWLDADDVRPGKSWVKRLLHGIRLSYKKPAKCVKELHTGCSSSCVG